MTDEEVAAIDDSTWQGFKEKFHATLVRMPDDRTEEELEEERKFIQAWEASRVGVSTKR